MKNREPIYDKLNNKLYTLAELENMGYGLRNTLQVRILKGQLKAIKVGKTWLVAEDDIT